MYRFVCLATLLVSALAVPFDDSASSRVVGGTDVPVGKYPFIVSIRKRGQHFCGGSIINQRWILTAAHCIYGNAEPLTVVAGVNKVNEMGAEYVVLQQLYHAGFDRQSMLNDIALLSLASDIQFNNLVMPIRLDTVNENPGALLTVIGWGQISASSGLSFNLKEVSYHVISTQDCRQILQDRIIVDEQICTYDRVGTGSCNGDSGGPLITQDGRLAGIVSYGIPCAIGVPDIYTKVSAYLNFIQSVIS